MIIFLVGTPGSGKGTQAALLAKHFNLDHISSGEMFRQMTGKEAEVVNVYTEKGDLVPDDIVIKTVVDFLVSKNKYDDLILDGSPRSLFQYKKFKEFFDNHTKKIDAVLYIKISDEEAIRRLTARREDIKTGKIYNLITNPPGEDVEKLNLIQRKDDKEDAIRERLKVQKVPDDLLLELRKDGILFDIDGERSIEVIFQDILEKLGVKND
jgi:adenylate kinase